VQVPEQLAVKILHDLASALKVCHERGIVHLDMKTENVLVSASMAMVLTDFGIALLVPEGEDGQKCEQKIKGTSSWMAPEAAKDNILTVKSDIFGLGLVMFHVCTIVQRAEKAKPFHTKEWDVDHELQLTDNFNLGDFPITYAYRLDLKDLIAEMLQPDWNKRPSAAVILEQISEWSRFENNFEQAESMFTIFENFKGIKIRTSNTDHHDTFGTFTR